MGKTIAESFTNLIDAVLGLPWNGRTIVSIIELGAIVVIIRIADSAPKLLKKAEEKVKEKTEEWVLVRKI